MPFILVMSVGFEADHRQTVFGSIRTVVISYFSLLLPKSTKLLYIRYVKFVLELFWMLFSMSEPRQTKTFLELLSGTLSANL